MSRTKLKMTFRKITYFLWGMAVCCRPEESHLFSVFYTDLILLKSVRHLHLPFHLKVEVDLQNRVFLTLHVSASIYI